MTVKTIEDHQVDTLSRESNSGPFDCEADTLPHDHGHYGYKNHTN